MSLHQGHRKRVKDRFIKEGLENFNEHQILELLLFFSIPRKDTNEIAHKLINEYGSISRVFDADFNNLLLEEGITENSACLLKLISEVSKFYLKNKWGEKPKLTSTTASGNYAKDLFINVKYERFYLICLNNQNQVVFDATISDGTIDEAVIYTRKVVEEALKHGASKVILAHNHPGESTKPSKGDILVTKRIKEALNTIDILVLDHIIVGGDNYFSFTQEGIL